MHFLFDMDGVLVDMVEGIIKTHANQYGSKFTRSDFKRHSVHESFGFRVGEEMEEIINRPDFFRSLAPYPGVRDLVKDILKAGHSIEICTSPPSYTRCVKCFRSRGTAISCINCQTEEPGEKRINEWATMDKIAWIHNNIPELSGHITITKSKHLVRGDMLIDDAPLNIFKWCAMNPDKLGYMVTQPWNTPDERPSNAVREDLGQFFKVLEVIYAA